MFSDVTIIKIEIEIAIFFRKIQQNQYRYFGASVTRFRYRIALEGPEISAGGHRMGLQPCKSNHAECGVYISANPITLSAEEFISSTPNIGAKKSKSDRHRNLYKKSNQNWIERKNQNRHITIKL